MSGLDITFPCPSGMSMDRSGLCLCTGVSARPTVIVRKMPYVWVRINDPRETLSIVYLPAKHMPGFLTGTIV